MGELGLRAFFPVNTVYNIALSYSCPAQRYDTCILTVFSRQSRWRLYLHFRFRLGLLQIFRNREILNRHALKCFLHDSCKQRCCLTTAAIKKMVFVRLVIAHPNRRSPFRCVTHEPDVTILFAVKAVDAMLSRSCLTGNRTTDFRTFTSTVVNDILQHFGHVVSRLLTNYTLGFWRVVFVFLDPVVILYRLNRIRRIIAASVSKYAKSPGHFKRIRSMSQTTESNRQVAVILVHLNPHSLGILHACSNTYFIKQPHCRNILRFSQSSCQINCFGISMQIPWTIVSKTLLLVANHRIRRKLAALQCRRIGYDRLKCRTRLTAAIQSTEALALIITTA
ncbi:hypothetical protein D3C76_173880 [compost metagenome]